MRTKSKTIEKTVVHLGWLRPKPVGGVGKTIKEQTRALHELGVPVEVWTFDAKVDRVTMSEAVPGFPHWVIPRHGNFFRRLAGFPAGTTRWLQSRLEDVHCFHMHSVFIPDNVAASRLGVPYVVTPNGGWSPEVFGSGGVAKKLLFRKLFEQRLWSKASMIQAVSRREMDYLQGYHKMGPLRYIPNGTEIPLARERSGAPNTILYLGRFDVRQKGLDILLDALEIATRDKNWPYRIVLAGPDYRDGRRQVEEMVRQKGLGDHVEIHGEVQDEEKEALFARATYFIHTSRWEGLPLVLLEALARGIPCILSDGTMVAEEWENRGCAIRAGSSPSDIAATLTRAHALNHVEMGRRALELARSDYNWHSVARELTEVYRSCDC